MASAPAAGYKTSPLGHSTTRNSPFRRPESPASPSPLRQLSTPLASPSRAAQQPASGTRLATFGSTSTTTAENRTPRAQAAMTGTPTSLTAARMAGSSNSTAAVRSLHANNAVSQLPPSQMRMLREGFQILDRDSDGTVGREDVADILGQLGLPANPTDVSQFFPPSTPQTITLAAFLSSLSAVLASLSPSAELLSAFSAFDDDDSGQIDLAELRDALLRTAPEPGERALTEMEVDRVMNGFTGRRAFSKSKSKPGALGKRGEVFKYQDFVHSIVGGNGNGEAQPSEES